jgi:hypothetical protein
MVVILELVFLARQKMMLLFLLLAFPFMRHIGWPYCRGGRVRQAVE